MSTSDIKLIIYIIIFSIVLYLSFKLLNNNDGELAQVFYDNKVIKTIDLKTNDIYEVEGYNGKIKIEVKDKKIRVIEETSKLHLCSYQGFIENKNDVIICLPNKVLIKIVGDDNYDSIAR